MSALTTAELGILVRRRMNAPVEAKLRFIPLIGPALNRLALAVADNEHLRHLLLTKTTEVTAQLDDAGVADLSTLITEKAILIDKLHLGNIYHASNSYPLRPLKSVGQGMLASALDALFFKYWLEGTNLHTKSADNNANPLTDSLSFAVPFVPTLAQLPEQLVEMLVEKIVELLGENHSDYETEETA